MAASAAATSKGDGASSKSNGASKEVQLPPVAKMSTGISDVSEDELKTVEDASDLDLGLDAVHFTVKDETSQAAAGSPSKEHGRHNSVLARASDSVQEQLALTAAAAVDAVTTLRGKARETVSRTARREREGEGEREGGRGREGGKGRGRERGREIGQRLKPNETTTNHPILNDSPRRPSSARGSLQTRATRARPRR